MTPRACPMLDPSWTRGPAGSTVGGRPPDAPTPHRHDLNPEVVPAMSSPAKRPTSVVITASLTTGAMRVTRGFPQGKALIEEILALDHADQETILWIGDGEYHQSKEGPFPNQQMRVSVKPSAKCAALSYTDHANPTASIVNSFNSGPDTPEVLLIFNGDTGDVFPQSAVIPIVDARAALLEWLRTRSLPTSINWRPLD